MVKVGSCWVLHSQAVLPPAGLQQNCSSLFPTPPSVLWACALNTDFWRIKLCLGTIALTTVYWLVVFFGFLLSFVAFFVVQKTIVANTKMCQVGGKIGSRVRNACSLHCMLHPSPFLLSSERICFTQLFQALGLVCMSLSVLCYVGWPPTRLTSYCQYFVWG